MKATIAHDFDGTLFDTAREVYNRVKEAWQEVYKTDYPFDYETYLHDIRSRISTAEEIFVLSHAIHESIPVPGILDKEIDYFRSNFRVGLANDTFYRFRKEKIEHDEGGWLEEQEPYEGLDSMLKELRSSEIVSAIVSSKDEYSISKLLNHSGLAGYFDSIIDKKYGKREQQFTEFKERYDDFLLAYDDLRENLEVAERMGIAPIAAPQGYDKEENLRGYPKANLTELPALVDSILVLEKVLRA
jgi:phosphoglycolate phosphatase-like HAD superfamily hydrolase